MKIITLCGCGLGTCFVLKFTAEKAVQRLRLDARILPRDLNSFHPEEADLYLIPYGLKAAPVEQCGKVVAIRDVLSVDEVCNAINRLRAPAPEMRINS